MATLDSRSRTSTTRVAGIVVIQRDLTGIVVGVAGDGAARQS